MSAHRRYGRRVAYLLQVWYPPQCIRSLDTSKREEALQQCGASLLLGDAFAVSPCSQTQRRD
jgi:hypothetical protein